MEDWKAGMLAKAKAGHDKDQLYVIIKVEPEYVYLADGKKRTLDRPKKKNRRHVQIIKRASGELQTKFENGSKIIDEEIKYILKAYQATMVSKEV
ncbi:KOW domain-containing RNA-binding protein [Diplocloster agilis]|uniref:KOW domain-containing RNA-binding protein n=1 Tax=Diplocloster agilis TaxID=2850323 RepID=A0A949JWM3_9FIRM|nr:MULTISPECIES: KOW domain-containing RNA-binding protein [Lachnospiraceae]MBU9735087.1 KOW domain-containing RNA-binding protein [Diplocloster agilis]MBU9745263.1 KOW domain-containing RNA-binding protein [Diplocloster agilis]MCU6733383.1 KOW domain-containing RNA-binding protein [Suonthocola fibrivorans]SCI89542.1 Uncharacterised protein [uncultured Clostridium sp.]